jgi:hypothetical protein
MAEIVAGMASSHAYTFMSPDIWDDRRQRSREGYQRRNGKEAPEQPQIAQETTEANRERYQRTIGRGLQTLKEQLRTLQPDVLVLIADDQGENYREHIPQFAIYTGDQVTSVDRESNRTLEHACDGKLANWLLNDWVEAEFDVASSRAFPEDKLISHAHAQVLSFLEPSMPIVPVFVNSIHMPAPSPARCYAFGQCLGKSLQAYPEAKRVALYASGGLSHFSQGFPYKAYGGPRTLGFIAEDFDREIVGWMRNGEGERLTGLTSRELLDNGDIELRCWITLCGVLGPRRPQWLEYEPFYRGIMGMAVAYWPVE